MSQRTFTHVSDLNFHRPMTLPQIVVRAVGTVLALVVVLASLPALSHVFGLPRWAILVGIVIAAKLMLPSAREWVNRRRAHRTRAASQ